MSRTDVTPGTASSNSRDRLTEMVAMNLVDPEALQFSGDDPGTALQCTWLSEDLLPRSPTVAAGVFLRVPGE